MTSFNFFLICAQVNEQAVMPGSGFFEAMAAAASVTLPSSGEQVAGCAHVTIPRPLILTVSGGLVLETVIDAVSGKVEVSSLVKGRRQPHCLAVLQQIRAGISMACLSSLSPSTANVVSEMKTDQLQTRPAEGCFESSP